MLKKWMIALGMVSVLTLAACNIDEDDDPADDDQMEEQESDDTDESE